MNFANAGPNKPRAVTVGPILQQGSYKPGGDDAETNKLPTITIDGEPGAGDNDSSPVTRGGKALCMQMTPSHGDFLGSYFFCLNSLAHDQHYDNEEERGLKHQLKSWPAWTQMEHDEDMLGKAKRSCIITITLNIIASTSMMITSAAFLCSALEALNHAHPTMLLTESYIHGGRCRPGPRRERVLHASEPRVESRPLD